MITDTSRSGRHSPASASRIRQWVWLCVIAAMLPLGAQAQTLWFWQTSVLADFTSQEADSFKAAIAKALADSKDTRITAWQSDDGKLTGKILPRLTFESNGKTCRRTSFEVSEAGKKPEHYRFDFCRNDDGNWQMVSLAPKFSKSELEDVNEFLRQVLEHQEAEQPISWSSHETDKNIIFVGLVKPELPDNCRMAAIALLDEGESLHGQYQFCKNDGGHWHYSPE